MDRFWDKVDKTGECWVWTAAKTGSGYGAFNIGGKMLAAHRVSYEWENGSIPEGLELDQLYRNRACVRPSHLEAVTHRENHLRGSRPMQTHCRNGHEFTEENTYRHGTRRHCRTCHRLRQRKTQDQA